MPIVLYVRVFSTYPDLMGGQTDPRSPDAPLEKCEAMEKIYNVLGKKWMGPIVDVLRQRPAHFTEIATTISVSKRMLSARLKELSEIGVVERDESEGEILYSLTEAGKELGASLDVLRDWAIKHMMD